MIPFFQVNKFKTLALKSAAVSLKTHHREHVAGVLLNLSLLSAWVVLQSPKLNSGGKVTPCSSRKLVWFRSFLSSIRADKNKSKVCYFFPASYKSRGRAWGTVGGFLLLVLVNIHTQAGWSVWTNINQDCLQVGEDVLTGHVELSRGEKTKCLKRPIIFTISEILCTFILVKNQCAAFKQRTPAFQVNFTHVVHPWALPGLTRQKCMQEFKCLPEP